jgi:prevent-host-death family protein
MKTDQLTEAKARLSSVIDEVEAGETINISRHGRTVAFIAPAAGDERQRRRKAVEEFQHWRKGLRPAGMTIEDVLSARDEGRR